MTWLTAAEAAALARVSRKTIYSAIRLKALRAARFGAGRSVRTTEQWVHEYLAAAASGGPSARVDEQSKPA